MYDRKTEPVPIPDPPYGKIFIDKKGYVLYITNSQWHPELGRATDSRTSIGKALDGKKSTLMYPGKNYYMLFTELGAQSPSVSEKRSISYLGNRLIYGPYAAFHAAAVKIGCFDALRQSFPGLYKQIEALALFGIVTNCLTAQEFEYWASHYYCGLQRIFSDSTISSIYDEIAENHPAVVRFQMLFKEEYDRRVPNAKTRVLAFDSTNQNTESGTNHMAAYGHAKKKKNIPIINTAVFVDEATGIPIYYEHFTGSILDKTQTPATAKRARSLGYDHVMLMMDRGYCTGPAVKSLEESELEFAVMVPDTMDIGDYMYEHYGKGLKNQEQYWIKEESVFGLRQEAKISNLTKGVTYQVYVFYDDVRAAQERKSINDKISFMESEIEKRVRYTDKLAKTYEDWFIIEKTDKNPETGQTFSCTRRNDVIQDQLDQAGFFCIISNVQMEAKEMIKIARHRDKAEKLFARLKTSLGMETAGVQQEHYEPKMFVSFVAEIIETAFGMYCKNFIDKTSSNTMNVAIWELSRYEIEFGMSNQFYPLSALTKNQKEIMKCLDIKESELKKTVEQII